VDPAVKGKIGLSLGRVPLQKAMDEIAEQVSGYAGFADGRAYLASSDPKGRYYLIVLETAVIPVGHLDVGEVMKYLAKHPVAEYLTTDETTNTICITAPGVIVEYAKSLIEELDRPQPQIRVDSILLDDSGIDAKSSSAQLQLGIKGPPNADAVSTISFANTVLGYTNTRNGKTLLSFSDWYARGKLKILAQPSVVVQNGRPATIDFGQVFYVAVTPIVGGSASNVQPIKAGVSLKVVPRVVRDAAGKVSDIEMDVDATDSDVIATSPGTISVTTDSREAKTTLCVRNGETVIIGGLMTTQDARVRSKVPILGDIPLLGNLFQTSQREFDRERVTILITARVVDPEEASAEAQPLKETIGERTPDVGVPVSSGTPSARTSEHEAAH
jgi:general secretion pathway protein D